MITVWHAGNTPFDYIIPTEIILNYFGDSFPSTVQHCLELLVTNVCSNIFNIFKDKN
jgi:hypothetical protein